MRNSNWIYKGGSSPLKNSKEINYDIIKILAGRGITESEEIKKFLNPSLENIGDPFGLTHVDIAVTRILEAIKKNETIWIYGDYDVDGITSTSLCYLALSAIGAHVRYYIPLRDEGYGLNCDALDYIASQEGSIVITVDCGITSHKEIQHGKSLGIDMIITDHHDIIEGILPPAFAVINPKREDNTYPFKYLAGVGTAFMLLMGLYIKLGIKNEIFNYLDIVAIGTVADIVSLRGDNRIFVKYGLERLKVSKSEGLRALLRKLFFQDHETRTYSPYDIGFVIAPVFNAAGRLEDAKNSVEMLISKDNSQYSKMIDELVANNQKRKEIQEDILEKVISSIERKKLDENSLILVADKEFHHGVIGIVASKILDRYYKPTIIMEIDEENGTAKGSCRSTEAFNMIEGLTKFSHYLLKFGGHHGAAGFSIALENLDKFYNEFNQYCHSVLNEEDTLKPIKIAEDISAYKIGFNLMENLKKLEPYGFDNPTPLFSMRECTISDIRVIGKDLNHISLTLVKNGIEIKNCIWWNSGDLLEVLEKNRGNVIDIAFKMKMESFRERLQYKVYIEDIKFSQENRNYNPQELSLEEEIASVQFPIKTVIYSKKNPQGEHCKIKFSENLGIVYQNRETLGYLDSNVSALLKKYSSKFNENFCAKISKIKETTENFNIFLEIYRDYNFKTYAIKDSQLFIEIKEFLIGKEEYTPRQKNILRTLFKDRINFDGELKKNSAELENLLLTIALYYFSKKGKILIITEEELSEKLEFYSEKSESFKDGYDFYIFLNTPIKQPISMIKYLSLSIS
ncbi:MAG: single-stranded-DNA-specific exonuclease RecJ [Fusobacteriaceae bacterium]